MISLHLLPIFLTTALANPITNNPLVQPRAIPQCGGDGTVCPPGTAFVFSILEIPQTLDANGAAKYSLHVGKWGADNVYPTYLPLCQGNFDASKPGEQALQCEGKGAKVRVQQPPSRLPADGGVNFLIEWDGIYGRIDFPGFRDGVDVDTAGRGGWLNGGQSWRANNVPVMPDA